MYSTNMNNFQNECFFTPFSNEVISSITAISLTVIVVLLLIVLISNIKIFPLLFFVIVYVAKKITFKSSKLLLFMSVDRKKSAEEQNFWASVPVAHNLVFFFNTEYKHKISWTKNFIFYKMKNLISLLFFRQENPAVPKPPYFVLISYFLISYWDIF